MARVHWVVIDDHGDVRPTTAGLPAPDRTVCADSGVHLALRLGLHVDLVVGDLDSADPAALVRVRDAGAEVQQHPAVKDHTDLELALAAAADGADTLVVLGGAGGRLDHALANVAALASDRFGDVQVRARLGAADVFVVRGTAAIELPLGATVTLLPSGGPVTGIVTEGLRYPLRDEALDAWAARGVSNIVTGTPVHITVRTGCLLVLHPHEDDQ